MHEIKSPDFVGLVCPEQESGSGCQDKSGSLLVIEQNLQILGRKDPCNFHFLRKYGCYPYFLRSYRTDGSVSIGLFKYTTVMEFFQRLSAVNCEIKPAALPLGREASDRILFFVVNDEIDAV